MVVFLHFDAFEDMPLEGDALQGKQAIPIHAGVGVIAPADLVADLLNDDRLVQMRSKSDRIANGGEGR